MIKKSAAIRRFISFIRVLFLPYFDPILTYIIKITGFKPKMRELFKVES